MKIKSNLIALAIGLLSIAAVSSAHADTINFDDISLVPNEFTTITSPYHDFTWNNFLVIDAKSDPLATPAGNHPYFNSGYRAGTQSGENVAFSGNSHATDDSIASFSSATAFTLNSFYMTAGWNDRVTVTVTGKVSGGGQDLVRTLTPSATTATLYTFNNWIGITEVHFLATGGRQHAGYVSHGTNIAIDNLTFNAPVPEPESYAMLLAGLGALGFVGRRRRKVS